MSKLEADFKIYNINYSYLDKYKKQRGSNKVIIPIFKQYQKEILKILIPDILDDYLNYLIENDLTSIKIVFSGIRVTRMVNIFFEYDFPEYIAPPRIERQETEILENLNNLDKFIQSKQISFKYLDEMNKYERSIIKFRDWYHKQTIFDAIFKIRNNNRKEDQSFYETTYPNSFKDCDAVEVSRVPGDTGYKLIQVNKQKDFLEIRIPDIKTNILEAMVDIDTMLGLGEVEEIKPSKPISKKEKKSVTPIKLKDKYEIINEDESIIIKLSGFNGEYDDPEIVYMTSSSDDPDAFMNIVGKTNSELFEFVEEIVLKQYSDLKPNKSEIEMIPTNEPTGLDLLKKIYLHNEQIESIFNQYLSANTKWNGKYDEEDIKLIDVFPITSNLVRVSNFGNLGLQMLFENGLIFLNRRMLEDYLKTHCSKDDLFILVKARYLNPVIKTIDIHLYYSEYFKNVFKYFNIDGARCYPSFIRFMIEYILEDHLEDQCE